MHNAVSINYRNYDSNNFVVCKFEYTVKYIRSHSLQLILVPRVVYSFSVVSSRNKKASLIV